MFRRFSIPTPFQIGPVNAYLAGRTLVDPGPDSDEAWARLLDLLEERELHPEDVEQVLVTHPHPDHFGIADRFRKRGARVLASPEATAIIEDFPARLRYEQDFFSDLFERCGMAHETAKTVTQLPEAFLPYAESVDVDRQLSAGAELTVDDEPVTVDSVTGHAPGELIFAYDSGGATSTASDTSNGSSSANPTRTALVGDNVLADITPNPFLQPPPAEGGERPQVLPSYNDSLERLADESYDRFLPGHREPISNPTERIEEILAEHEARSTEVLELVDGPTTPVDVMSGLFGDLPATEQFSGMSEAVGHLDVLEQRGQVEKRERGGVVVYEPTTE